MLSLKSQSLFKLNGIQNRNQNKAIDQSFYQSLEQIEQLCLNVEKAKEVCKCEKKTLHEKASNLSLLFKDILGYKEEEQFDFGVTANF